MYKEINIGANVIPMTATASTAYRYKQVFHDDFLALAETGVSGTDALEMIQRLAYVMAMQAAKADMTTLSVEGYLAWVDNFDMLDFVGATDEIMGVFQGNAATSITPKKKHG